MGEGQSPLVLLVEDEPDSRALLERWLTLDGFEAKSFADAESAIEALSRTLPSAVCLDLELPGMNGLDALGQIRKHNPELPVVILTADRDAETAMQAIRSGAHDYLSKPIDRARLTTTLANATAQYQMQLRIRQLERESAGEKFGGMLGESEAVVGLCRDLYRVAASDVTVLIRGESGTGKELVANGIHSESKRSSAPFVAINCAAIPESLQESEFFGHEKGAFTGANARRVGRFEQANGGTLFLDEIAELSHPLQAKLLRALQERSFRRVGGSTTIHSDFRLIAASHRDLRQEVEAGNFREDLYYRIAVFEVEVPPLRERTGDVVILANAFVSRFAEGRSVKLDAEALTFMSEYEWPGNVRELQNAIQRALVLCRDDVIRLTDLPPRVQGTSHAREPNSKPPAGLVAEAPGTLEDIERRTLEGALRRANGNVAEVVRELGIGRTTVYRKLKKYGLRSA
jgi:DNA-binding NtrC family response regulator